MSSDQDQLALRYTTVNRPQLQHSNSKQSITASEDYYSASEGPSSESDGGVRTDRRRYSTPPLRRSPSLPEEPTAPIESAMTSTTNTRPRKPTVTFDNSTIIERPETISEDSTTGIPANTSLPRKPMPTISPSTTPGLDDTPYIRFAIDQLTRDEEVRGPRHYQGVPEGSQASYPVERRIPDEGLGYFGGPGQNSPHGSERSLNSESGHPNPNQRRSVPNSPGVLPRLPGTLAAARMSLPATPTGGRSPAGGRSPQVGRSAEPSPVRQRDFIQPDHLRSTSMQTYQSETNPRDLVQKDIFVPHKPARESLRHPPLNFLPSVLRIIPLLSFILLCKIVLAALVFSAVWSLTNDGLWEYGDFGDGRYFVFQYLPTTIGMIILTWLFQIQTAVQRVAPFMALSSESTRFRAQGAFLKLQPMSFLLPNLQYFHAGQMVFGIFAAAAWLFLFTIPLLSSCFNARHYGAAQTGAWMWVAVQGVIWATIALFVFLVLSLDVLFFYLRRRETGLRWDPRSIADIIVMLERSNIVNDYEGSETFDKKNFRAGFSDRTPLLGYWHTSKRQTDVFYGLGGPAHPTRQYSIEEGKIREKAPEKTYPLDLELGPRPIRRDGDFSIRMDIRSSRVRLRYLPWYLRDSSVAAWVVIAIVLLLAFLIISFINDAVRTGFDPRVRTSSDSAGFSPANFLFSIVPGAVGLFLFLAWQSLDLSFRALAPYSALSNINGATAEQSLLVDYSARFPVSVTVVAAANGHYTVAILSLFTLINTAIPILSGGVFWTQYYMGISSVRVAAHLPGFFALCVFLSLYAVFIGIIFSGRKRMALPHASNTLNEIISWVYQSPILADRAFNRPATKAELVTRLMGAGWTDKSTFSRSVTALVSPSRQNLAQQRKDSYPKASGHRDVSPTPYGLDHDDTDVDREGGEAGMSSADKHLSILEPGTLRYGFGIHVGRDNTEHLGIDRLKRGSGREMVIYEQTRRSWRD